MMSACVGAARPVVCPEGLVAVGAFGDVEVALCCNMIDPETSRLGIEDHDLVIVASDRLAVFSVR